MRRSVLSLLLLPCWLVPGFRASAASPVRTNVTLTSSGVVADAAGTAEITLRSTQSLDLSVSGLEPLTAYLVRVDGVLVGALNTGETGTADSSWSTSAHGKVL